MAGFGGSVVARQYLYESEVVEGVGLAGHVTDVAEHRYSLGQAGCSGRIVADSLLQLSKIGERSRLAKPVIGLVRGG